MGLTIYYSGRLRKAEDLPTLVEEIRNISNVYGWKYHIYNTHFPNDTFESHTSFENVYGITFLRLQIAKVSLWHFCQMAQWPVHQVFSFCRNRKFTAFSAKHSMQVLLCINDTDRLIFADNFKNKSAKISLIYAICVLN